MADKLDYIPDGQMTIFDWLGGEDADKVKIRKPIKVIELFAGYGSQALAFKYLGVPIEHHFVCEFDRYACASYNAIHGTNIIPTDIRNVSGTDLNITDTDRYLYFCSYSFPCTDLSIAGFQKGMSRDSGTRSGLLWEVERILKELYETGRELPQILMMENVPQVHGKKAMSDFQDWLNFLDSIGYYTVYQDLNAKDYGIPQNRNRCFAFSFLKKEFGQNPRYNFPKPIQLSTVMMDYLEDEVDEKYYINSPRAKELLDKLEEDGTLEKEFARQIKDNL